MSYCPIKKQQQNFNKNIFKNKARDSRDMISQDVILLSYNGITGVFLCWI